LVTLYFFKWVESPTGGNGGPNWVNEHVEAFINIGGPLLGLPKALSALLSGIIIGITFLTLPYLNNF